MQLFLRWEILQGTWEPWRNIKRKHEDENEYATGAKNLTQQEAMGFDDDWKGAHEKGYHIHYIGEIPYSDIDSDVDTFKSGKMTLFTLIDSAFIPELRSQAHADTGVWWERTAGYM